MVSRDVLPVILACAAALGGAAVLHTSPARAQCDAGADGGIPPEYFGILRDTFPADQDRSVPTDGVVRIRFLGRAPMNNRIVVRETDTGRLIDGAPAVVGDELVWQATPRTVGDPLDRNRSYTVVFNDASGGINQITFRTGSGRSSGPPQFAGVQSVSAQQLGSDPCDANAVEITARWNRATSAGGTAWPAGDIEYVIYQTRGPGIAGPRERERVRIANTGVTGDSAAQRTFRLQGSDSTAPVCFNIQAVDPLGRADGNATEQCVNPAQGNYFAGCRAAPGASSSPSARALGGALLAGVAVALSARRRPRRRRRP